MARAPTTASNARSPRRAHRLRPPFVSRLTRRPRPLCYCRLRYHAGRALRRKPASLRRGALAPPIEWPTFGR
eukprot:748075-Pyramimonas_sp.AAC.1